jgi:hypothetical protein
MPSEIPVYGFVFVYHEIWSKGARGMGASVRVRVEVKGTQA